MAQELCVVVSDEDRVRLEAIIGDRTRPVKHVQRARIVLLSAERLPVLQVAGRAGVSRPAVWRWQRRYAEAGVTGLLRDKTRAPGKKPVAIETVNKVLALTCGDPPGEMTHWTGRAMAKTVSLALHTVQRIWRANRLQPHRLRTFKRSSDPALAEKVEDIVGLYMHPPAHAVVLSIDEKSQIQALDRPVRCPQHARRCRAWPLHAAPYASSTPSSAPYRPANWFTPFSTITPPTSIPRSKPGSPATRAGSFTSPQPPGPGSMRLKASSLR